MTVVPFNSQITRCPLGTSRQRKTALPSALKSPVAMTVHGDRRPTEPAEPPPMTLAPSISQTTTCPVLLLYQMMSALPSPLRSPVPGTPHESIENSGTEPTDPPPMTLTPSISHITTCPV